MMIGISASAYAQETEAFLIGSATPGGWELSNQTAMTVSESDTNIFIYNDTLTAGEFKIKLYAAEEFCDGMWMHPLEAGQSFDSTGAAILVGCADDNPDYKWEVTEAGIYTIEANLSDTTVAITLNSSFQTSYDSLFLVGSATPGGWDLAGQSAFAQAADNEYEFVWEGMLTAGELKIKTYAEEDFCAGEWIHPNTENAPPSATNIEILVGCASSNPDYKWVVSEAETGNYEVTVDIEAMSISFEKLNDSHVEETAAVAGFILAQNYPNPFNPTTNISFTLPRAEQVQLVVYDAMGRRVQTIVNSAVSAGEHSVTFNARGLASGMYIYRLVTSEYTLTKKMSLLK